MVKIAEEYEPFSFIWGRLDRWLVDQVAAAQSISPEEGRTTVLAKYFSRVIAAQLGQVARLFGWSVPATEEALCAQTRAGVITDDVAIEDDAPEITGAAGKDRVAMSAGKWYIHTNYC
jgi:hypothetical protein